MSSEFVAAMEDVLDLYGDGAATLKPARFRHNDIGEIGGGLWSAFMKLSSKTLMKSEKMLARSNALSKKCTFPVTTDSGTPAVPVFTSSCGSPPPP